MEDERYVTQALALKIIADHLQKPRHGRLIPVEATSKMLQDVCFTRIKTLYCRLERIRQSAFGT